MSENTYNILMPLLKDFTVFTAFALFFVSLLVGLLLLLQPSIILRLNNRVAKKFSLRRMSKVIEVPNKVDHLFYRHHRILGIIVTLTSAYVLYYFITIYDAALVADYLNRSSNAIAYDILITAIRFFMLISSAVILLIGVAIIIRPSQLKSVETWANCWISTRQSARPLAAEHDQLNQLAYNYPRLTGLIIVCLSLYASTFLFFIYTQ
jgi:hypothetical protein